MYYSTLIKNQITGTPNLLEEQIGMGNFINDINLADEIAQAIIGEVQAYRYYERLAQLTNSEYNKQSILRILHDEARHYHWFSIFITKMGLQLPKVELGEIPTSFQEGVKEAIRDELDAASFYQEIAYRASVRSIQLHFKHASNDEQRHASMFQNMLMFME